ncbi:sugar ABC transporter ATP-binding protein [Neorhizobium galegae]|uniref:sugar ABC transporter ATP-binding protein n=1 Tax=Neorhizobium galegae TaxID=399 RepID=UPI0006222F79|nr:sugar ABC transporter ATP-binding protein [Neorhizobium galegae]MCQ1775611.1 sugar ABC transporter ATP-binding protein [Neorhizobium galegae]MCQ1798121.1 sugar ABC transporter ATP-binding protein [Neorhizobium galegae]CDZ29088.1 Ribose ABC transporter, ATP-binding protein RbsA [Neorhizobium galegae bv. officinalis]
MTSVGGAPATSFAAANNEYVLEMRGITKSFPGVRALDGMNLRVRPGSVHVLVGENGAGKSTLMKILSGIYAIDEGEIFFQAERLDHQNAAAALERGISMIHQELSPVLDMTIAENIFLGREPTIGRKGVLASFVDFTQMNAETQKLFEALGLKYSADTKMRDLSIAAMQLVEIVKAISRAASLVIMDEPTSAISDTEVSMLFQQIADLKANGVAIIYITHKMEEIFQIADDITVMRDGQFIATGPSSSYTEAKLISQMVGRTISSIFPKEDVPIGDVVLSIENVSRTGVFEDVNLTVRAGEIVGLAGLIGAGRTEVARVIFGLDKCDAGTIRLNGTPIKIGSPTDAIRHGIAMVSEDRTAEGLVLCRSVGENISLANLKKFAAGLFISKRQEETAAKRMIKLLQIKTPSTEMIAENLSGGNQQKIVLAKWLLGDLKVLILDEPTRGIDVGSKSEIHKLMTEFARQGLAILMISSELPEVLGMSDRVMVMSEGRVAGELTRSEATQESVMRLATGGH